VADAPDGSCSPPLPEPPGTRTASKDRRGSTGTNLAAISPDGRTASVELKKPDR
jgi:hypothetical protein